MKKIKLLTGLATIPTVLMVAVPLASCSKDKEKEEETKQVKDIRVEGNIEVNKSAVVTYTIDSNFTLDVKGSTIKFADSNAEEFSLVECEVDTTNHKITIPACRVTSTNPTFNFVSMKINAAITKEQVIEEINKVLTPYEGKNQTIVYTSKTDDGVYTKETIKMKNMDQAYSLDTNRQYISSYSEQCLYNQNYKVWIDIDQTKECTLNSSHKILGMYTPYLLFFDWTKIEKIGTTNAWKVSYAKDDAEAILSIYFDKNNKLDHGEFIVKISGVVVETANALFDYQNDASFTKWDMPEITKCKNYVQDFTNKSDVKVMYSIKEVHNFNVSGCIAFYLDLSTYTNFATNEDLKFVYKIPTPVSKETTVTIKVNNEFLSSDKYSYDSNTGILLIKKEANLESTDKLFAAIGSIQTSFGGSSVKPTTLVISQESSSEVKTAYFYNETHQYKDAKVLKKGEALGELPELPSGYTTWKDEQGNIITAETILDEDKYIHPYN